MAALKALSARFWPCWRRFRPLLGTWVANHPSGSALGPFLAVYKMGGKG